MGLYLGTLLMSVSDCTSQEKQQVLQYLMPQLMCSYAVVGDTMPYSSWGNRCMYVCMYDVLEVQLYVGVVCSCAIVLFHPLPSADFTGDPAQFQECY